MTQRYLWLKQTIPWPRKALRDFHLHLTKYTTNAVIDYLGRKLPGRGMEFTDLVVDDVTRNVSDFKNIAGLEVILTRNKH